MDLGPDPTDRDEIIQRYGRRLFVLAYHLTGDATEAEELSHECLVRGLLAPDFPSSDTEAGVFLHRGLISLWRERMEAPGSGAVLRIAGGAAGAETSRAAREHAGLWRALSRLDPVSRAVFVLRVAGGLEYETIGRVLDMAPDVVYARLLQARGGLQDGERSIDPSLFETMNLFLDDRLPVDQRGDFETRLMTDAALRDRVEFHRGLTLDLHEEAPALPRAYVGRLRERLDRAQETLALVDQAALAAGWEPAAQPERPATPSPKENRLSRWVAPLAGALVVLAIGVALGNWAAWRRPAAPGPGPAPGRPGISATPGATPDEATIEALRSLGYLAPAKERPKKKTGTPAPAGSRARPAPGPKKPALAAPTAKKSTPDSPAAKKPAAPAGRGGSAAAVAVAPAAASPSPVPSPSATPLDEPSPVPAPSATEAPAAGAPAPAASPSPEGAATPSPTPATNPSPPPAEAPHQDTAVTWRVMPVARAPMQGRDFQVIRTEQDWAKLFHGTDAPPPAINFDGEMVVLLRAGLAGDPPFRVVIAAVKNSAGSLQIECLREPPGPDAGPAAALATAGQAVVVPISDLPIRVVVR